MNIISSLHDVYSADAENLMAGGHVAHVIEYINEFRMHAVVPWQTVEDIYILVNIKENHHWVLAILSFSKRCIFLYDSYESSGHYSAVLDVIEKLAAIISLCLEHCDFYVKKGIHVENHPRYKGKDSSDMFDVLFQENLPQQPSGSLDCGVYMITYAECLSYDHKNFATEFDPNALRTRYAATLWDYGTRKKEKVHYKRGKSEISKMYSGVETVEEKNWFYTMEFANQTWTDSDCGVFMVMYAECLSYGHKVIASDFDPNELRTRYAVLLWDYGIRKQEANVISDVEAPVRPARQSRITSVTEVVDV
ncbi:hypothetical protein CQW23_00769 [Capsicum baccatum]|uniref:Ubiquitin-like protease family profile domain-containing protein n=1 Tax=Capsicum baccatum TaxID=33114 RepID=A0A2G2XLN4_CAPBA|nr:hypothetical protein CQW23_00769 [Capsicum baccatum]